MVLSLGMVPGDGLAERCGLQLDSDGFVATPSAKTAPCATSAEGIFVAGTSAGPKDIVDTITEAGAAAAEASLYLRRTRGKMTTASSGDSGQPQAAEPVVEAGGRSRR